MSTEYYHLRSPFSDIKSRGRGGAGDLIIFYIGGEYAGHMAVPPEFTTEVMSAFADRDRPYAMHTAWGGAARGTVVTGGEDLPPSMKLISSSGGLYTVKQVRAMAGKGKADEKLTD